MEESCGGEALEESCGGEALEESCGGEALDESCGGEAGSEPGCMRTTDEGDQSGLKVHTQTYHAGQRRVAVE